MTDSPTAAADPALVSLVAALAAAELAAAEAADAHRAAEAARDQVRTRIAELDAARREIGTRRAAGDLRDADRADVAVLATDIEALGVILSERDATVAAARADAERTIRDRDQARVALVGAEDKIVSAALVAQLEKLDGLVVEVIRQANEVARRRMHGQTSWAPSIALEKALVPLFAARPRW